MNSLKKQKLIFNKKLRKKRNEKIIGEKDFHLSSKCAHFLSIEELILN